MKTGIGSSALIFLAMACAREEALPERSTEMISLTDSVEAARLQAVAAQRRLEAALRSRDTRALAEELEPGFVWYPDGLAVPDVAEEITYVEMLAGGYPDVFGSESVDYRVEALDERSVRVTTRSAGSDVAVLTDWRRTGGLLRATRIMRIGTAPGDVPTSARK